MGNVARDRRRIRRGHLAGAILVEDHRAALDINAIILAGDDLFRRPGFRWSAMQLSDYFPATLLQQREKYAANILG